MGVMGIFSKAEARVFPSHAEANRCGSDDFLESKLAGCQWDEETGVGFGAVVVVRQDSHAV